MSHLLLGGGLALHSRCHLSLSQITMAQCAQLPYNNTHTKRIPTSAGAPTQIQGAHTRSQHNILSLFYSSPQTPQHNSFHFFVDREDNIVFVLIKRTQPRKIERRENTITHILSCRAHKWGQGQVTEPARALNNIRVGCGAMVAIPLTAPCISISIQLGRWECHV